eukprot:32590-Prymnesium_polylepis.1
MHFRKTFVEKVPRQARRRGRRPRSASRQRCAAPPPEAMRDLGVGREDIVPRTVRVPYRIHTFECTRVSGRCSAYRPHPHVATFASNARCRSPARGRGRGSSQRRGRGAARAARRHARRRDASCCAAAPARAGSRAGRRAKTTTTARSCRGCRAAEDAPPPRAAVCGAGATRLERRGGGRRPRRVLRAGQDGEGWRSRKGNRFSPGAGGLRVARGGRCGLRREGFGRRARRERTLGRLAGGWTRHRECGSTAAA